MARSERGEIRSIDGRPLVGQGPDGEIVELSVGYAVMQETGLNRLPPWVQITVWIGGGAVTLGGVMIAATYLLQLGATVAR